ncbi:hypothetical protein AB2M62_06690 [Sphingomonas sp. MMS12-HWE2-04]|uniref:hypothetical protein n=1 Tax=Sphingomonas sp. MMS12-HWE2-04 TaxID=3234199 RepID=UPI00384FD9F3
MAFLCTVMGHNPNTTRHSNQGLEFSLCHHCGRDLIRSGAEGEWTEVPEGFRVVWREFGRAGDAASVAARMARMAPAPRRRDPRNARPAPRRDPRGRPFTGVASMVGTLSNLGKLIAGEVVEPDVEKNGQYVIHLPGAGMH